MADESVSALDQQAAPLDVMVRPQAEARAYNPSWRDKVGSLIAGDSGSPMRRRMAQEAVGSSGIGTSGFSAIDLTPVGSAFSSQEAATAGDIPQAVGSGMAAAAPFSGPAVRALMAFIRSAPGMAAAIGGAGGALISSEAGSAKLTERQQRQIELQKQMQKATLEGDIERQKSIGEQQRMAKEADARLAIELERKNAENKVSMEAAEKDRQANMPFRERFPNVAAALPIAGGAVAMGVPYLSKLWNINAANKIAMEAQKRIGAAESALPTASPTKAAQLAAEMKAIRSQPAPDINTHPATIGLSGFAPLEASLLPSEYDAMLLPPGNKDREAAWKMFKDPAELAKRAAVGVLQGAPLAGLGSKIPSVIPQRYVPVTQAQGLEAGFNYARKHPAPPKQSRSRSAE